MLSTLVKISNVTNLSDARYCSGMGVEWIGFSVDEEDDNYVSPKNFREIKSWLAGVKIMAETSQGNMESIMDALKEYEVDGIQVLGSVLASEVSAVSGKTVFVKIDIDAADSAELISLLDENPAEMYILESASEQALDDNWKDVITFAARTKNILLGFGLNEPELIPQLLSTLDVAGIALKGSEEIRPGYKVFGTLMDILEVLEEDV